MTDIYDLHTKAFARVSAFVTLRDGERVATIAFKFPADGAGRLYAYIHWIGAPMVRGYAGGYGYDKKSAARADAASKIDFSSLPARHTDELDQERAFRAALERGDGSYWDNKLRDAGFTVLQAV